jgi:hypothetical protein
MFNTLEEAQANARDIRSRPKTGQTRSWQAADKLRAKKKAASDREEAATIAWLLEGSCGPVCTTCATGIHDVEQGVCPCCQTEVA